MPRPTASWARAINIDLEQDHGWLADHRIQGMTVFPGAGYVERALAAGLGDNGAALDLCDVEFQRALILEADGRRRRGRGASAALGPGPRHSERATRLALHAVRPAGATGRRRHPTPVRRLCADGAETEVAARVCPLVIAPARTPANMILPLPYWPERLAAVWDHLDEAPAGLPVQSTSLEIARAVSKGPVPEGPTWDVTLIPIMVTTAAAQAFRVACRANGIHGVA